MLVLAAMSMVLSWALAGCGGGEQSPPPTPTTPADAPQAAATAAPACHGPAHPDANSGTAN